MKITNTTESKESLKKHFEVIIAAEGLAEFEEAELLKAAKTANIKGFRKGKVPLDIIKKQFGDAALVRAFEAAVKQAINQIYKDYKLQPIAQPEVKLEKGDPAKREEVTISVVCEELAEMPDLKLEDIELVKTTIKVIDSDIDDFLHKLSEQYANYEEVKEDRPLAMGDVATIDFVGSMDGKKFPGGAANNHDLELGSKSFIDNFEEQLVGLKVGEEKTLKVHFPDPYAGKPEYAGKEAQFEVKVKAIKTKTPCPVTDLHTKVGIESEQVLREDISKRYQSQYEALIKRDLKNQVLEKLANAADFPLPESLVKRETEALEAEYQKFKENQASSEARLSHSVYADKTEDEVQAYIQATAQRRIKTSLIFNHIASINNLEVSPEEVEAFITKEAANFPAEQAKQMIKAYKSNPNIIHRVSAILLEEKILAALYSKVKYKEQNLTIEEYNAWLKDQESAN